MASTSSLFMYSLTLRRNDAVNHSITGNFTSHKHGQQILTAHGSILSLYDVNKNTGKRNLINEHDVFAIIGRIAPVRPSGSEKDFLIITSDSGRMCILEFLGDRRRWAQVHAETFGKSGVRRSIPGKYLAVDPKGRACMISAIEKFKLVYIIGRTQKEQITVSSPLEATKHGAIVFSLVALDVGYDNPTFAALEADYSEVEPSDKAATPLPVESIEKQLVLYELDLGINYVVRKHTERVERSANLLFQVPGGDIGPGGVFVCSEDLITLYNESQPSLRVAIPRRKGATEDSRRKRYIVCGGLVKLHTVWFWLLQTEDGDFFRLHMEADHARGRHGLTATRLVISYFDTVPVAQCACVLRSGYIYTSSETGDEKFYMFKGLGADKPHLMYTSDEISQNGKYEPKYFQPEFLDNLLDLDLDEERPESVHPVIKTRVMNLAREDAPQIYAACGTGARSSIKIMRHALKVEETARDDLPNPPTAVFTLKMYADDERHRYILLSFELGVTLVLEVKATVEEIVTSGFRTDVPTLAAHQMGESMAVQVYPQGVRMVRDEPYWGGKKYFEYWHPPQYRSIVAAAMNTKQLVLALSDGQIYYMQVNEMDELGTWQQTEEEQLKMDGTVTAMGIGPVPEGREICPFVAIGCDDLTIHIISLDPSSMLETRALQGLTASPSSVNIMPMPDPVYGGTATWLHIGLSSGNFIRTLVDDNTGELSDTRTRFLGTRPVVLVPVVVEGKPSLLALSRTPWLGYMDASSGLFQQTPLDYDTLNVAAYLISSKGEDCIVATAGKSLRILSIPNAKSKMKTDYVKLMYTPRDFVRHPFLPLLYIIESEQHTLPPNLREQLEADAAAKGESYPTLDPKKFGYPRAQDYWSSCIQIVDVIKKEVVHTEHMTNDECLTSIAIPFIKCQDEHFLIVGTGKKLRTNPRSCEEGFIHVYRFWRPENRTFQDADGTKLEYIYNHSFEDAPMAITPFNGLFLFGVGANLFAYDLGATTTLRKSVCLRATPYQITGIQREHNRIICSDVRESVSFVVYKPQDNRLVRFSEDTVPRWMSTACFADYRTAAGGDKFGNLFMLRVQESVSKEADSDITGGYLAHDRAYLGGTQNRLELVMHYFTQDIPTSVQKTPMIAGGAPILFWAGLQGTMGFFIPLLTREEVDFFMQLEVKMRDYAAPITGRDHLYYRGYYEPVKGCVDGDLCEQYFILDRNTKAIVAAALDKTVREVEKRITDARIRFAF